MVIEWDDLAPGELAVLETLFWSAGTSRSRLAERAAFSKSKANGAVSALLERGLLEEVGMQASSGGRRPETCSSTSSSGNGRTLPPSARL